LLNKIRTINKSKLPSVILAILQLTFIFYIPNPQNSTYSKPENAIIEFVGQLSPAFNFNKAKENRAYDNYKIIDIENISLSLFFTTKIKSIIINNVVTIVHISKFTPNKFSFRGPPFRLI